ncbi:MAG: aminotransferase [Angelakisella sp.]|jgi:aspartate/methionine/tyrosine aminotransferase|nr:aminotransferase [Angelakisella sp.]
MKIRDFGVEMWMNAYENDCTHNLAETCVRSLTVEELLDLSGKREETLEQLVQTRLTYGDIPGSPRLRQAIAGLYQAMSPERVTITNGAIGANALTMLTLVEPGDRVISVLPTYQQHYSIPESIGAQVDILQLREENGWLPDLDELRGLVKKAGGKVRLININNPNNPTGSVMEEPMLREIAGIAREAGAWLLCDEVYRGLCHQGDPYTASVADLYEKGISTGSMSKVYSLAGLRLGWIAGPRELTERLERQRDYHIISVGRLDDLLASVALESREAISTRNLAICREGGRLLAEFVAGEPHISYVKPKGGTTAFLRYDLPMESAELCRRLQEETGVMLLPGSALDMEGYLRIGYCNDPGITEAGLARFGEWLRQF